MASARPALALALWSALTLTAPTACGDDNRAPALALLTDRQLQIGQTLVLELAASDPDGDRLSFRVSGLPETAQVSPRSATEAVLVWSPLITDTQPGGRRFEVTVTVDDDRGGRATQTFGLVVYPTFGIPSFALPAGLVLNLATQDALELAIEVKDDDTVDVLVEMTEAPDGARFQMTERKLAFFYWRPDDEQRKVAVHRAIFRATDDTNPPVSHVLTIVLLNAERQSGCEGQPPTLTHAPPADQPLTGALRLGAVATDAQSQVQSVTLHWARGPDPNAPTTAVPMRRVAQGSTEWTVDLELGTVPNAGALVHYHLVALDNDDPTGLACDLSARLPRAGAFTAAVYPPGSPASSCLDDSAEPDDSTTIAPRLKAGLYPGRRLCGPDLDLVEVDAPPGTTVSATVTFAPTHGTPTLRLVTRSDATIAEAPASGAAEGRLTLRHDVLDDTPLYVEVAAPAQTRMSYTLELAVAETRCEDDPAEPDSRPDDARPLALGQTVSQRICNGDSDYFALALQQDQPIRLALAFDQRYGDLDLELLAADGLTVLARSASERSLEELQHRPSTTGLAFARVYGVSGASNEYSFTFSTSTSSSCPSDGLGQNTSPAAAAILFQGVYENFKACPDAPDWFAVDLNDAETLDVLALADEGAVTIDVFRDPGAAPIATGLADAEGFTEVSVVGRGNPERLFYRIAPSRLPATSGGVPAVTYAMLQDLVDPPGPCRPDRLEPNAPGAPAPLAEGVHTWLRLCGDADTDAFRLTVPAFTTLIALTSHLPDRGYGDLELRSPTGALLADELDLGEGAYLELLLEQAGDYVLLVKPFEVVQSLGYDLALFFD